MNRLKMNLKAFADLKYERSAYFDQFRRDRFRMKETSLDGNQTRTTILEYVVYDSTAEGLKSTPTFGDFCSFCGSRVHPIQANISLYRNYDTTGYFCDCVHAASWLAIQDEIQELQIKHKKEMRELVSKLPIENKNIERVGTLNYETLSAIMDKINV